MEIELEISVFNIKDGKLSNTFFEELPWHVLNNHFKVKGGASSGSLFSSPDTFVVWEIKHYRNQNDYEDWNIDKFFPKKITDLLVDKKNWKTIKITYSSDLKVE